MQLPLNFSFILELYHTSFGERHLFDVIRGVNFSFGNPLDSYFEIVPGKVENVVIVL